MPLEGSESTRNSSFPGDTEGPSSYLQHLHWIAQLDPGHLLLPLSANWRTDSYIPFFPLTDFSTPSENTISPDIFSSFTS